MWVGYGLNLLERRKFIVIARRKRWASTLNNNKLAVIYDVQQLSLFSHLQFTGSFRHIGQIIAPHPTHVLSALLQAQWLQVLVFIASHPTYS